jgi:hypothetical protein
MKRLFVSCLVISAVAVLAAGEAPQVSKGSGIIFFRTTDLKSLDEFYIDRVGCEMWIDQGACHIYRYGNLLLGFCQSEEAEVEGMITFFYPKQQDIEVLHEKFKDVAESAPKVNQRFRIYHFFARDPEGRAIEFQYFMDDIEWDFRANPNQD